MSSSFLFLKIRFFFTFKVIKFVIKIFIQLEGRLIISTYAHNNAKNNEITEVFHELYLKLYVQFFFKALKTCLLS